MMSYKLKNTQTQSNLSTEGTLSKQIYVGNQNKYDERRKTKKICFHSSFIANTCKHIPPQERNQENASMRSELELPLPSCFLKRQLTCCCLFETRSSSIAFLYKPNHQLSHKLTSLLKNTTTECKAKQKKPKLSKEIS